MANRQTRRATASKKKATTKKTNTKKKATTTKKKEMPVGHTIELSEKHKEQLNKFTGEVLKAQLSWGQLDNEYESKKDSIKQIIKTLQNARQKYLEETAESLGIELGKDDGSVWDFNDKEFKFTRVE